MLSEKPGPNRELLFGPANLAHLAMSVAMLASKNQYVPPILVQSQGLLLRGGGFGVVACVPFEDGTPGPVNGMFLATVGGGKVAKMAMWWVAHGWEDTALDQRLLEQFIERAPDWMQAVDCIMAENAEEGINLCRSLGMKAVKLLKGHYGEHDGIVFRRPILGGLAG